MRNVWRKALVTVGIVVALGIGPGIGTANAQTPVIPPLTDLALPEFPEGNLPAVPPLPVQLDKVVDAIPKVTL